ncbi:oxidoreductase [Xylaria venustula]|nr:oxidoreductase [Xylaria venustula]
MESHRIFDFIIVGGGTAGLVVATRLSEDPRHDVLVVEAGSDHDADPRVKIPALFDTLKGTNLDWNFISEPQSALGMRKIHLNQGKALGGSSAINAFVFVPPTKRLIDSWEALGNEGWNWNSMQPYFSKAYSSPPHVDAQSGRSLGVDRWADLNDAATGPLQTSFPADLTDPIREAWVETFAAEKQLMLRDPFISSSVGSFSCIASIHPETKERSYSVSAYYKPVRDRENLHILTDAKVVRILFNNTNDRERVRASGVRYRQQGHTFVIHARKEVILAAGALQSPKILELSGIGNAKLLEQFGISVIIDLPGVGENLQDHAVSSVCFEATDAVDTLDALIRQEPEPVAQALKDYGANRTGPMSHVGVTSYAYLPVKSTEGGRVIKEALVKNRLQLGEANNPRELVYFDLAERTILDPNEPTAAYLAVSTQTAQSAGWMEGSRPGPLPGKFLTIGAMLSQPLSRGTVHIQSSDHAVAPMIDPKYLTNPIDMEVHAQHMLNIERIASAPSFNKLLKQPLSHGNPASHLTSAAAAKQYLCDTAISMWHLGCTCAMLPRTKGGVVGKDLKVYGVENLRIVDSSALPMISTANLQATVYAFAERASDIIKATYDTV